METPREVNSESEVIPADAIPDTPEAEVEDGEEEVIPPVSEDGDEPTEPSEEDGDETEEEDAPESSPEGPDTGPDEGEEEEEAPEAQEPPAPSQEPAPVPGETPREKALRKEITRLRTNLRKNGLSEVIPSDEAAPSSEQQDALKQLRDLGYSDEQIASMETAIDVLAQRKGYVKKSETQQEVVSTLVDELLEAHPEYKPENDTDDIRWTRFNEIIKSGVYNLAGKSKKEFQAIFNRVHRDVVDELGEVEAPKPTPTPGPTAPQRAAQQQKVRSVAHSGGTKAPKTKTEKETVDPSVRNLFKGFDKGDLE